MSASDNPQSHVKLEPPNMFLSASSMSSVSDDENIKYPIHKDIEMDSMINDLLEDLLLPENENGSHKNFASNNNNIQTTDAKDDSITDLSSTIDMQNFYSKIKFGRTTEIIPENSIDKEKFVQDILTSPDSLPLKLTVEGLPSISRVENQLKLNFSLTKRSSDEEYNLNQLFIHLPTDSMSKSKFYLNENDESLYSWPQRFKERTLFLDAFLLCNDSKHERTMVCDRCVKREQRRASRRKSGLCDNILWCNNPNKSALIINNKQLLRIENFNKQITDDNKTSNDKIEFILTTRIVCYCRHQKFQDGFQILFIIKDYKKNIIAKTLSDSIMIMDKKSNTSQQTSQLSQSNININANPVPNLATPKSSVGNIETPINLSTMDFNNNKNMMMYSANYFPSPSSQSEDSNIYENNSILLGSIPTQQSNHSKNDDIHSNSENPFETRKRSRINYDSLAPTSSSSSSSILANSLNYSYLNNNTSNNQGPHLKIDTPISSASSMQNMNINMPTIHRIIPAQGPISGGVEVTLLGSNFKPGQTIKFGENIALSTQFWNPTTMVTYLPPASSAGQVIVSIKDPQIVQPEQWSKNGPVFTYIDDTDKQIIELALQIVGLKMNGKLDDPRNIARQIVDSSNSAGNNSNNMNSYSNSTKQTSNYSYDLNTENLLIKIIERAKGLNFALGDDMGRTILHYSCLKAYKSLTELLLKKSLGLLTKREDSFGFLPIHFAAISGDLSIMTLLESYENNTTAVSPLIGRQTMNGLTTRELYLINNANTSDISIETSDTYSENESSDYSNDSEESEIVVEIENSINENNSIPKANSNNENNNNSNNNYIPNSNNIQEINRIPDTEVATAEPTSLWNRMVNRFNDEVLPKYDDLFPKGLLDNSKNTKSQNTISSISSNVNTSTTTSLIYEDDEDDENDEDFESALLYQREVSFQNDKMLLYFWLPLLIILSSWMLLYSIGDKDGMIHNITDSVSNYLRIILTKLVIRREMMSSSIKNHLSNFQPAKMLKDLPKTLESKLTV